MRNKHMERLTWDFWLNGTKGRFFAGMLLLCFVMGWSVIPAAAQETDVWDKLEITGEVTWEGTVYLHADVIVTETGKLTIAPGTVIKIDPRVDYGFSGANDNRVELIVNTHNVSADSVELGGILVAEGTEDNPIVFEINSTEPAKGDWQGIRVLGGKASLAHCNIHYARNGLATHGNLTLAKNCVFEKSERNGVFVGVDSTLSISDSISQNNNHNGIYLDDRAKATITNSDFLQNEENGIYAEYEAGPATITGCQMNNNNRGIYTYRCGDKHIAFTDCIIESNRDRGTYF